MMIPYGDDARKMKVYVEEYFKNHGYKIEENVNLLVHLVIKLDNDDKCWFKFLPSEASLFHVFSGDNIWLTFADPEFFPKAEEFIKKYAG